MTVSKWTDEALKKLRNDLGDLNNKAAKTMGSHGRHLVDELAAELQHLREVYQATSELLRTASDERSEYWQRLEAVQSIDFVLHARSKGEPTELTLSKDGVQIFRGYEASAFFEPSADECQRYQDKIARLERVLQTRDNFLQQIKEKVIAEFENDPRTFAKSRGLSSLKEWAEGAEIYNE